MVFRIPGRWCFYALCILTALFLDPPFDRNNEFEAFEATACSIHDALFSGRTSCRAIIEAHLARIDALNPRINAIITLNQNALEIADAQDTALADGNVLGALFSIPTLLKHNFDTQDMPTTGGCLAMKQSRPVADAPVVKALKDGGAIILGKTNMH